MEVVSIKLKFELTQIKCLYVFVSSFNKDTIFSITKFTFNTKTNFKLNRLLVEIVYKDEIETIKNFRQANRTVLYLYCCL